MSVLFRMRQNVGKHIMSHGGQKKVLRPGDTIRCEKYELGNALDKFEQLEPDPPAPAPKVGLRAVHIGFGKYNVISDATGKPINDEPLTKEEARAMERRGVAEAKPDTETGGGTTGPNADDPGGDSKTGDETEDGKQTNGKPK